MDKDIDDNKPIENQEDTPEEQEQQDLNNNEEPEEKQGQKENIPQNNEQQFGPYTIYFNKIIKQNQLYTVYEAIENQNNNKIITAKIINKQTDLYQNNSQLQQYIRQQIEIWEHIHHKNVIEIYDVYEDDEQIILFLEFCEQGNMPQYIENLQQNKQQQYTQQQAEYLLKQIHEGFRYLVTQNISEILLQHQEIYFKNDTPKLNIQLFQDEQYQEITSYIPPETLQKDEQQKRGQCILKQKIWNLGILTYYLFYQQEPFQLQDIKTKPELLEFYNKTFIQNLESSFFGQSLDPIQFPYQNKFNIQITENLKSLILEMVAYDPDQRINFSQLSNLSLFKSQIKKPNIQLQVQQKQNNNEIQFNFDDPSLSGIYTASLKNKLQEKDNMIDNQKKQEESIQNFGKFDSLFKDLNHHMGAILSENLEYDSPQENNFDEISIIGITRKKESYINLTYTTYYIIQTKINDQIQKVERRYKHFESLHNYFRKKLKIYNINSTIIPGLPPKDLNVEEIKTSILSLFFQYYEENYDEKQILHESEFLRNRELDLQQYLQYINKIICFNSDKVFYDFLMQKNWIPPDQNIQEVQNEQEKENELIESKIQIEQNKNQDFISYIKQSVYSVTQSAKASISTYCFNTQKLTKEEKQIDLTIKEIKNVSMMISSQITENFQEKDHTIIRNIAYLVQNCLQEYQQIETLRKEIQYYTHILQDKNYDNINNNNNEQQGENEDKELQLLEDKINLTQSILDNCQKYFLIYSTSFKNDLKTNFKIMLQILQKQLQ